MLPKISWLILRFPFSTLTSKIKRSNLLVVPICVCLLDYSSHFSAGLSEMPLWEQARSWSLQHAVPSFLTGRPFLFWHGYACPIYTKHACTCLVKVQSIYGNSRRVKVTRCPWSNVALTTFIYYLRHWRHCTLVRTCLIKVQSIYGNSCRVKVTRCPWSNEALTTFIHNLFHWRHCTLAQTCLIKVQSI